MPFWKDSSTLNETKGSVQKSKGNLVGVLLGTQLLWYLRWRGKNPYKFCFEQLRIKEVFSFQANTVPSKIQIPFNSCKSRKGENNSQKPVLPSWNPQKSPQVDYTSPWEVGRWRRKNVEQMPRREKGKEMVDT